MPKHKNKNLKSIFKNLVFDFVWNLKIGAYLEFGAWSLGFKPREGMDLETWEFVFIWDLELVIWDFIVGMV